MVFFSGDDHSAHRDGLHHDVLLERSLSYALTDEIDQLSIPRRNRPRVLPTGARFPLRDDAGRHIAARNVHDRNREQWPPYVSDFAESSETERFAPSESGGERLQYFVRHGNDIWMYARRLGNVRMDQLTQQISHACELVEQSKARDPRKAFLYDDAHHSWQRSGCFPRVADLSGN